MGTWAVGRADESLGRTAAWGGPAEGRMTLYFWTVVGGLVGTGLMDVAEKAMERLGITDRGS